MLPQTLILLFLLLPISLQATVFPMGGKRLAPYHQGRTMTIGWDDELQANNVDIGIWDGATSQLTMIATRISANEGSYVWSIPQGLPTGDRYRIMVRDADAPLRAQYSSGYVSIGMTPRPIATTVKQVDEGVDVQASPFPAAEMLTISWRDRDVAKVELLDLHRRLSSSVEVEHGADHARIDVRSVPSGLYFARLVHRNGSIVIEPAMISR
jgi:hypothetical protein